jgi:hypothetical protein
MFDLLRRLASYLSILDEGGGVCTRELLEALEDAFNAAHLELWLRHDWDPSEKAMKHYPIICEAAYAVYAAQVAA